MTFHESVPAHEKEEAKPLETREVCGSHSSPEASPRGPETVSTEVKLPDTLQFSFPDGIEVRKYQQELAEPGLNGRNYIICAPTGTGKTLVSSIIIKEHLNQKWHKGAKVLFMVGTNPLAKQQKEKLGKTIIPARVECQTGDSIGDMSVIVPHSDIIVCTAGKFQNDLRAGKVYLSNFSLMIIDECHNVRKNSPQANMMIQYLQEKKEGNTSALPQVVGLTASPGAGDSSVPDREKTLEHLIHLCALMDASSGIKVVEENEEELNSYIKKSSSKLMRIRGRNIKADKFISAIDFEMIEWELKAKVNSPHSHTSEKYQNDLQQQCRQLESSDDPEHHSTICMLEFLICLSKTLSIYLLLRQKDAMRMLEQHMLSISASPTLIEQEIKQRLEDLKYKVSKLSADDDENPYLTGMKDKILAKFKAEQGSRAIVFASTKYHAQCLLDWASQLPCIKAAIVTGHTRETGYGMTEAEQQEAIKGFDEGKYNLIVTTSVLEEGIDVVECNLVIRYHHVSNEIARVQAQGRGRAENSEGITILESASNKAIKELINEEKDQIVKEAIQHVPWPSFLKKEHFPLKQKMILWEYDQKVAHSASRKLVEEAENIVVKCCKCKSTACCGSDLFTLEEGTQHVVPDQSFRQKFVKREHPSPRNIGQRNKFYKSHKMYCKNCGKDWGIIAKWAFGSDLPVLKCKSFVFVNLQGLQYHCNQWSKVPFGIKPLHE